MNFEYRFKTEEEFIKEYGKDWRHMLKGNNFTYDMNYLLGKPFPYEYNTIRSGLGTSYYFDDPSRPNNYGNKNWYIIKDMLTKNIPNYKSKKFNRTMENLNEGLFHNDYQYNNIIILFSNLQELEESKPYLNGIIDFELAYNTIKSEFKKPIHDKYYMRIHTENYNYSYKINRGSLNYLNSSNFDYDYEKIFTINDLKNGLLDDIKKNGKYIIKPNYKPKKFNRTMENFNEFTNQQLLLEKSSLTKLGVPREVMQPIQRDFAIPADAEWDRMALKRNIDNLFRNGDKELLLQISIDYIKVFVSQNGRFFVDTYVMKDTGWSGEYEKLDREYLSITQLLYQIEPKTLIYRLKSDFSVQKQGKRKLMKKEKDFEEFTNKFKQDFLTNFNAILKRIVGSKYTDAKKEIQDKAKQIEMENQMMISGLDDPFAGPNSMTILDNFISEFEEAYSDFFGEYLNIQELSEHFTREKILTSFMFFIYTGRLLEK